MSGKWLQYYFFALESTWWSYQEQSTAAGWEEQECTSALWLQRLGFDSLWAAIKFHFAQAWYSRQGKRSPSGSSGMSTILMVCSRQQRKKQWVVPERGCGSGFMARVGGNSHILPYPRVLEPNVLLCTSCACHRKTISTADFPATASGLGLPGAAWGKLLLFLTGCAVCSHMMTAWNQNETEIWFVFVWSFWRSNGSHQHHLGFKRALCCSMTLLLLTSVLKVSPFNSLGTRTFVHEMGTVILAFLLNSLGITGEKPLAGQSKFLMAVQTVIRLCKARNCCCWCCLGVVITPRICRKNLLLRDM